MQSLLLSAMISLWILSWKFLVLEQRCYSALRIRKTTFINVLSGIVKPISGLIKVGNATFFDSENKINLPMEKRGIGYVFQDGRLFPHMSVEENLDFGRKRSNDKTSRKKEIIELLGSRAALTKKTINIIWR